MKCQVIELGQSENIDGLESICGLSFQFERITIEAGCSASNLCVPRSIYFDKITTQNQSSFLRSRSK